MGLIQQYGYGRLDPDDSLPSQRLERVQHWTRTAHISLGSLRATNLRLVRRNRILLHSQVPFPFTETVNRGVLGGGAEVHSKGTLWIPQF